MAEKQAIEVLTKEVFDKIVSALEFRKSDTSVKAANLFNELERQGELAAYYRDCYARLGRYKMRVERQVKAIRAKAELECRVGQRAIRGITKMTDATVKACVEADEEVAESEDLLVEVTWWYNQAANYALAMEQRIDIIRMLQKEKDR